MQIKVLEPLPPSSVFRSGVSFESVPEEEPEQENKVNNIVAMDTTILPLDIMLYLNVQSSKILFDGMQQVGDFYCSLDRKGTAAK